MRRMILVAGSALALTLGGLSAATAAPHPMHMGPGPGHVGPGPGHVGPGPGHFGGRFGGGFGGPVFGFGFGAPYYDYAYGGTCYSLHRVWTPFGWRWHRVWVC